MLEQVWLITTDHLNQHDDGNEEGTWGTPLGGVRLCRDGKSRDPDGHGLNPKDPSLVRFQITDYDGEVYYTGVMTKSLRDSEHILAPLNDFGTPNAGATMLEIWDDTGICPGWDVV